MSIQAAHKVRMNLDALTYAHKVLEAIGTPVALSCSQLLAASPKSLTEKTIKPSDYTDPIDFYLDYQAIKLLSKYPHLKTGVDTRAVAKSKFDWAEHECLKTNVRWRMRENGYHFDSRVERVISTASRKISDILGVVPSWDRLEFGFGPGAAYGVRGDTSVFQKVTSAFECTYALADRLGEFLAEFPGWVPEGTHNVTLIPGSQLTFVPKDAKTDRPICIEPLLNGLYQKGFGTYIRKRLSHHGIILTDQGVNQKLASLAQSRSLATVDFSSASDTISYRLVMDLLPIEWFEALDLGRCPRYECDGKWTSFQKFTSMGNGYTFELETLIFYALAYATCEELGIRVQTGVNLSVYGDDVIIPQAAFDLYHEVAVACGFTLNVEKSFKDGSFFESCGHDYFLGENVRPYLLKKRINTLLPAFYAANTIRRFQNRLKSITTYDARSARYRDDVVRRLDGVHSWVVGRIPRNLRVVGPEGFGDGHLLGELDEAAACRFSRIIRHRHYDAWWFTTYADDPVERKLDEWPIAYALYHGRSSRGSTLIHVEDVPEAVSHSSGYAMRGRTRLKKRRVLCHGSWPSHRFDRLYGDLMIDPRSMLWLDVPFWCIDTGRKSHS